MNEDREFIKKGLYLFILVLISELIIYFRDNIYSFLPWLPAWFIPSLAVFLAFSAGWFFYAGMAKNDKEKNLFIEIATHKFRTPISIISWSADSLETGIDITQRREEVKKIRGALEKMREIIDTLMGVIEARESVFYHFNPVKFRDILEEVLKDNIRSNMKKKGIDLYMNIPKDLPLLYVDNKRIAFVLKNLIENAVTYSKEGGLVDINVKTESDKMIFSIRDDGIGISENDLPNIFSSFYRSREAKLSDTEGMGLGLYVSKKIIEKHNGKIWAESGGKGKGATFFLEFKMDKYKQLL